MGNYTHIRTRLLKDTAVKRAYDALEPEFSLIRALIKKRTAAGLSQSDLAKKIGTRQSAISRLESGRYNPTVGMLRKVARALEAEVHVSLR